MSSGQNGKEGGLRPGSRKEGRPSGNGYLPRPDLLISVNIFMCKMILLKRGKI